MTAKQFLTDYLWHHFHRNGWRVLHEPRLMRELKERAAVLKENKIELGFDVPQKESISCVYGELQELGELGVLWCQTNGSGTFWWIRKEEEL